MATTGRQAVCSAYFFVCSFFWVGEAANAGTIFQTATIGPTGSTAGFLVAPDSVIGARFAVRENYRTSAIGGHFFGDGQFFGAIVHLNGALDVPDSKLLNTPDVLGVAHFSFSAQSRDERSPLSVVLRPGNYAIVFGSGLFGVDGSGGAAIPNNQIGDPSFIYSNPGYPGFLNDRNWSARFFVEGDPVPEPSAFAVTVVGVIVGLRFRRLFSRQLATL